MAGDRVVGGHLGESLLILSTDGTDGERGPTVPVVLVVKQSGLVTKMLYLKGVGLERPRWAPKPVSISVKKVRGV